MKRKNLNAHIERSRRREKGGRREARGHGEADKNRWIDR